MMIFAYFWWGNRKSRVLIDQYCNTRDLAMQHLTNQRTWAQNSSLPVFS
jgi:hypothetical protein